MTGWISLHRKVTDHWLYEENRKFSKFEAWIDLLFMVNYKDKKMSFGNELIEIKRGQRITSIRQLCDKWNWSNNKVKNFLNLLENDGMIEVKSDSKKTLITIVNYDVYQSDDLEKRHKNDSETTQTHHKSISNAHQKHFKSTQENKENKENKVNKENNVVVRANDNNTKRQATNVYNANDERFKKIVNLYQENIEHTPSPITFGKLTSDYEAFGYDLLKLAIEKSALNNNHSYRFINFLLVDWNKKNLSTIEAVEQYENNKLSKDNKSIPKVKQANQNLNYFPGRSDLTYSALTQKLDKLGFDGLSEEEQRAIEKYY